MSFINMFYRTGASNINKELERAINERNCDEVKVLLSTGADINHTVNQNLDTMLHTAKTAGIARDLLGYSANVNARNLYEKTPLHSAVADGKNAEFVKTLLSHGADIDAKDSKGNTPLNCAVKKGIKSFDVIKELIKNGADINMRNHECRGFDTHCTPLDNAVLLDDLQSINIMIKYTLLKKPFQNCASAIDLRPYQRRDNYRNVLKYLNSCGSEILKMKMEKMNDKISLYQIVMPQFVFRDSLYKSEESKKVFVDRSFEVLMSNDYPIYHDVILDKLRSKLEKIGLVKKLNTLQIYTSFNICDSSNPMKKIILDSDSTSVLARFLSANDIFNLILAYSVPTKSNSNLRSIRNLIEIRKDLNKRICEASTSGSSMKVFKFS